MRLPSSLTRSNPLPDHPALRPGLCSCPTAQLHLRPLHSSACARPARSLCPKLTCRPASKLPPRWARREEGISRSSKKRTRDHGRLRPLPDAGDVAGHSRPRLPLRPFPKTRMLWMMETCLQEGIMTGTFARRDDWAWVPRGVCF